MNNTIIPATIAYIQDLFRGNSGGHDAAHSLRVYRNALLIAEGEPGCDTEIIALAALLHDADDHKLFQTEGNANARSFLNAQKVAPEKIERICEAINAVSFSQNRGRRPETLEGRIVQDADRLDALGAIGIARTFAYGGEHGRSLDESVAHFHEKLLLLKDELNTETARRLAEPRHAFLERFLEEYEKESNQT
ncbi:MAG: HD domain-containing protein [Ruminococcaceae bacterium]|nr:HD domain-containing protein [Oscillospiraceae bacterium]